MANSWNVVDWLTMEGLRLLINKLEVAPFFDTSYNSEFTKEFAVGETVRVPLPNRGRIRTGLTYDPQAVERRYTTITVDQVFGYDFEWDDVERALRVTRPEEALKKQVIEPAIAQIKQEIDSRCALWAYQNTSNIVGVLGTDPTSFDATSAAARQRLIEMACPPGGDKGMIVPPSVTRSLKNAAISYFNPASDISKQYREGSLGKTDGFDWYESMSLYDHTAGTWAGAVSVNTTLTSGATSMVVNCTSGDTFKKGDVIGIAGRYRVNPMTRRTTTTATTYTIVVAADVTASASTATITFVEPVYGPDSPYQNITVLPTASDVLTLFPGTASPNGKVGKQGLAIHPQAFALVGVKLYTPKAVEMASQQRDPNSGISFRFVKAWDPIQSKLVHRFDVCLGFGNLYPDNCSVRVLAA
jgi:hypothetical protein